MQFFFVLLITVIVLKCIMEIHATVTFTPLKADSMSREMLILTVEEAASAFTLDPLLVRAIVQVESNWNPDAFRPEAPINDASRGLMQVLCGTAKQMGYVGGCDNLFDPELNAHYGCKYLRWQMDRYNQNVAEAVAAYNSGTVRRNDDGTFRNQAYVDKVFAEFERLRNG